MRATSCEQEPSGATVGLVLGKRAAIRSGGRADVGPEAMVKAANEADSVFLKSPKVRFQKRKYFLSIPCIHARRPQTGYETLLLLHKAPRFGDVLLNSVKVIFEAHSRPRTFLGK
jgi:hypothetical protein